MEAGFEGFLPSDLGSLLKLGHVGTSLDGEGKGVRLPNMEPVPTHTHCFHTVARDKKGQHVLRTSSPSQKSKFWDTVRDNSPDGHLTGLRILCINSSVSSLKFSVGTAGILRGMPPESLCGMFRREYTGRSS